MAYNLLNLCQDTLEKGVVHAFEEESTLFTALPVIEVSGSAYAFNQVEESLTVEKRNLGEDIVNIQEMVTNKVVQPLEIFANSIKVDRSLVLMSSTDVRAEESLIQSKSLARACHKEIINYLRENAGIKVTTASKTIKADDVADAMDDMKMGKEMLLMAHPKTLRELTKEAQTNGYLYSNKDAFGKVIPHFNGVPCVPTHDLEIGQVLVINCDASEGSAIATNGGVRVYDRALQGVNYITDVEILFTPVIKNKNSVVFVEAAK